VGRARRSVPLGFLLVLTAMPPAAAGVFSVTPVHIDMIPRDRAVAVTITNQGDNPVVLQAELNLWTQTAEGKDELAPTDDLILAPPIVKLGPKAHQVVRLARLKPADATRQLTYRMILREIPEAVAPKDKVQVSIALALSMPVFITPPPAKPQIACGASVSCANSGSAYAQVREILVKQGERLLGRFEGGVYILPAARKVIPIKADRPGPGKAPYGAVQLVVSFDDGRTQTFKLRSESPGGR